MPEYKNGKIYKLVCNITGLIYIGSTTVSLSTRKAGHSQSYKRFIEGKGKNHGSSTEIIKGGNYSIILIEEYPCETKEQLLYRERYYIDTIQCVNIVNPIISREEAKGNRSEWSKNRQWHCDTCNEDYHITHQKYHLTSQVHLQKLNNVNPNECPECHKVLSNTSKMRRHLREVHKIEPEKKKTDFYCEKCDCCFQSNQHLQNHYKTNKHKNK